MAIPDFSELEAAAREIVYDHRRAPVHETLTPRMVRQALETKFALPTGALEEFKESLKLTLIAANEEDLPEVKVPPPKSKKRKSEEMKDPKPRKKQNEGPPKMTKNSTKVYKSLEMIPSDSDEEMGTKEMGDTSLALEKLRASEDSAKENQAMQPKKHTNAIPQKASGSVAKPRASTSAAPDEAADSDSELSVLEDEPKKHAKKTKATKPKDKAGDKPKASRGKKGPELSKDEETIKRLKSLVLACGVRRVWAKVFKDVDQPSQQIRMLKEILADLGMSGRMSLEQAKAIKEKRELAQELEDVQAFAAAATRPKLTKASQEEEEEESEEEEHPAKRKMNARRSIMAFLEDQSDED
ncbi:hypothetical protein DFH09DRAFT_543271 [Mycena vulgaris]|nr:hypothetical protein DFH09DRAFT_543271 [Mycena vulgaris]